MPLRIPHNTSGNSGTRYRAFGFAQHRQRYATYTPSPAHSHYRSFTPTHTVTTSGAISSQPKIVSMLLNTFTPPAKRISGHSSQLNHFPQSRVRLIIS